MCASLFKAWGFPSFFVVCFCFSKAHSSGIQPELQGLLLQFIWKYFQTAAYINLATCMRTNKSSIKSLQELLNQCESGIWHGWDGNLNFSTLHPNLCLKLHQTTGYLKRKINHIGPISYYAKETEKRPQLWGSNDMWGVRNFQAPV